MLSKDSTTNIPTGHILGAGALGSLWGVLLAQTRPIHFITKSHHFAPETVLTHVHFESMQGEHSTTPFLLEPPQSSSLPAIQFLLIFTKSYDTEAAFEAVINRINKETRIILFQNGMGVQQQLAAKYPELPLYAATTTEGAFRHSGKVTHAGTGETLIGALTEPASQLGQLEALFEWLNTDQLKINASQDINIHLWHKLAINCCINPFTALLNCPNGEIRHHTFFLDRIKPLCQEIALCAEKESVTLNAEAIYERVQAVLEATQHNISSMLQDVRAQRQTEIHAINGYIMQVAHKHGLSCPINQQLTEKVSRWETDFQK